MSTTKRVAAIASALLTLGSVSTASPTENVEYWLPVPIPYAADSGAPAWVKEECGLASDLPIYIDNKARRGITVFRTERPLEVVEEAKDTVLFLEFSQIDAPRDTSLTAWRSITVRGELREHGEITASFEANRRKKGNVVTLILLGGEDTCSMLDRCALKLAKDIAKWLKNPTMSAKLGESQ